MTKKTKNTTQKTKEMDGPNEPHQKWGVNSVIWLQTYHLHINLLTIFGFHDINSAFSRFLQKQ